MKILMLTLYLPYPPTSGGQIRSYNLIKNLSKKHEITLVAIIKKGEEKYASELEKYCKEVLFFYRTSKPWTLRNVLKSGLSPYPFLVIRNTSEEAKRAISRKLTKEQFDLIHVETFYLMPHVPKTAVPILLVDQTIEFQVYQHYVDSMKWWFLRPLLYLEVLRLRFWETKFWQQADKVVAVSQADARMMKSYVSGLDVGIIPNAPGDDLSDLYQKRSKPNFARPIVYFQSGFLWLQNVEGAKILARQVFPLIKKQIPEAICHIVGQSATRKIGYLGTNDVKIIDLENDDIAGVRQAYLKGTVFVAPLWGPGGTRLKILSAMSTGVPVVTTPVGIEGIEAKHQTHVLIGKNSPELASLTVKLLKDKKLYEKIVVNARKLIEDRYGWQVIADKLSKIYEETAAFRSHS
ncbi:glycosyltransferase [Candidatus Microgenomates bacterium]|nr:glycosyltransferase [Candidatus Microgenomates bacterium]